MSTLLERFYPEARFGGFTHVDGTVAFFARVNSLLKPTDVVLDVGCGRGRFGSDVVEFRRDLQNLRGKAAKVIGIDVDDAAGENPFIDDFRLIQDDRWPVADASIDLAVSDYVVEHVLDPDAFFSEAARVIKPGGYFCVRTPNSRSYFGLAAILIPGWLHGRVAQRIQEGRREEDVFPTVYRCNTRQRLRKALQRNDFTCAVCSHEAEPAYLCFSRIAYWFGVLHQRMAPIGIRVNLLAFAQRCGNDSRSRRAA